MGLTRFREVGKEGLSRVQWLKLRQTSCAYQLAKSPEEKCIVLAAIRNMGLRLQAALDPGLPAEREEDADPLAL